MLLLLLLVAVLPLAFVLGLFGLRAPMRVLLPLYAVLVPFGSGITVPVPLPPPFNTVTSLLGVVTIVALAAQLTIARRGAPFVHAVVPWWFLLVGVNAITFLWSIDRDDTAEAVFALVSLVVLAVLAVIAPADRDDLDRLADGVLLGGVLACMYGFMLLLTGNLPEENAGLPRFAISGGVGDAADPNITAAVLVMPLVLAATRALDRERRPVARVAATAAAVLVGGGILLTASRGGVLAAFVALAIVVWHAPQRALVAASLLGAAVAIVLVASTLAPDQVERLVKPGSSGRTNIWRIGAIACERYCLVGSGFNTFPDVHERILLTEPGARGRKIAAPPHNMWLGAAVETGIAGLAALGIGVVVLVRAVMRLPAARRAPPLASVVGLVVANIFLANLRFKYFWLVLTYAALACIAEAVAARETTEQEPVAVA